MLTEEKRVEVLTKLARPGYIGGRADRAAQGEALRNSPAIGKVRLFGRSARSAVSEAASGAAQRVGAGLSKATAGEVLGAGAVGAAGVAGLGFGLKKLLTKKTLGQRAMQFAGAHKGAIGAGAGLAGIGAILSARKGSK